MAEEFDGPEVGDEAGFAVDSVAANPAAVSVALGGASREEADAFLKTQRHLLELQTEHLHEQRKLLVSHLKWRRFNDRSKGALQVLVGFIGAAIVLGLLVAAWKASQADGLMVDAFSVPPKFTQNGLTGDVIANDLTDDIAAVRNFALSNSIGSSTDVQNDSRENIKVEIPDTGVSLGQAWRDLRVVLGHESHLSGSLRLVGPEAIALTVELNGEWVATTRGASSDLDKMEQQAAEQVFASVDPINYVLYLVGKGRDNEVLVAAKRAVQVASGTLELADANGLWGNMIRVVSGDVPLAMAKAQLAAELDPKQISGHRELMWDSILEGHDEEALRQARLMTDLRDEDQPRELKGRGFAEFATEGAFERAVATGAFAQAALIDECLVCSQSLNLVYRAEYAARAHDGAAYRAAAAKVAAQKPIDINTPVDIAEALYFYDTMRDDWSGAADSARAFAENVKDNPIMPAGLKNWILRVRVTPLRAYALARSDDLLGAQAEINSTPMDCYNCMRVRGQVAAAARQWGVAQAWFDRAVEAAPSLPFAYADWGQMLLAHGDVDTAIAKFAAANKRGPQFADPLELWGEALMKINRSDLALAKFEEASKYAPNWGRLHLKWGEALFYAGKKKDAQKQFAFAATLDISPAEKSELAHMISDPTQQARHD